MNGVSSVYVVRVWYEPSTAGLIWRASVSIGQERYYFSEPSALAQFFTQQYAQALEDI